MSPDYVDVLSQQFNLALQERDALLSGGVSTQGQAYQVLLKEFRRTAIGLPVAELFRRASVLDGLGGSLGEDSELLRAALDRGTGAAAPSPDALVWLTEESVAKILDSHVPEEFSLGEVRQIDLVDTARLTDARRAEETRRRYKAGCANLNVKSWVPAAQGRRGTCVAFATASCIELLRVLDQSPLEELSPQFLYWHMLNACGAALGHEMDALPPNMRNGATKLGHARHILETRGICQWSLAPYRGQVPEAQRPHGEKPRPEADRDAKTRVLRLFTYKNYPTRVDRPAHGVAREIYEQLASDRPVAVAVPQFFAQAWGQLTNWNSTAAYETGVIPNPVKGATAFRNGDAGAAVPGHVVCVTGFQPDPVGDPVGGGWFIFRNSWGPVWPSSLVFSHTHRQLPPVLTEQGYGAMSAMYVEKFCWEWLSIRLNDS